MHIRIEIIQLIFKQYIVQTKNYFHLSNKNILFLLLIYTN